ncbi:hypothetical protein [Breznakiella homolactica]|uniref:Uncharacterized protein n=1 Tax=Breznakiella homolactica TaxID=2798577 RepID=A0A7T7XKX6_9SPIR|nr:hypothetical protein [Breznakiella homolactica]QQO08266.1 hypothetical protein JFL75_15185 [Breznakiella homolactica]
MGTLIWYTGGEFPSNFSRIRDYSESILTHCPDSFSPGKLTPYQVPSFSYSLPSRRYSSSGTIPEGPGLSPAFSDLEKLEEIFGEKPVTTELQGIITETSTWKPRRTYTIQYKGNYQDLPDRVPGIVYFFCLCILAGLCLIPVFRKKP